MSPLCSLLCLGTLGSIHRYKQIEQKRVLSASWEQWTQKLTREGVSYSLSRDT